MCRHRQAFPSISGGTGYMWCPDCGAVRDIIATAPSTFKFSQDRWLVPKGKEDVLRQIDLMEKRKLKNFTL